MTFNTRVAAVLILSFELLAGAVAVTLAAATQPAAAASSQMVAVAAVCESADEDARIVHLVLPAYPWIAGQDLSGTTIVEIQLMPNGHVAASRIASSSGNPLFDREALNAARESTYAAAVRNCARISGAYHLIVDFTE